MRSSTTITSRAFLLLGIAAAFSVTTSIEAGTLSSGPRTILHVGCHLVDNICYARIDGDAVGPTACTGTSLRWNSREDPGGKNVLALLLMAKLTKEPVVFGVEIDECFIDMPRYPTFNYMNILTDVD